MTDREKLERELARVMRFHKWVVRLSRICTPVFVAGGVYLANMGLVDAWNPSEHRFLFLNAIVFITNILAVGANLQNGYINWVLYDWNGNRRKGKAL